MFVLQLPHRIRHLSTYLALAGLVALPASGADLSKRDEARWAGAVLAELRKLEPTAKLTFDGAAFAFDFETANEKGHIFLRNDCDEATVSHASAAEVAVRMARIHLRGEIAPVLRLLPGLRERSVVEVGANLGTRLDPKLRGDAGTIVDDPVQYRPVGESLALILCEDERESMRWLTRKGLEQKRKSFDVLLTEATQALLARPPPRMQVSRPGVYRFDGDEYGTAHFVLGDLARHQPVKGDPVAVFTSRETVFLTGSEDVDGVNAVFAEAGKEAGKPRAWTPRLLRLGNRGWVPFRVTRPMPLSSLVEAAAFQELQADYDRQTDVLRAWSSSLPNGKYSHDEDVFAAKLMGVQKAKHARPIRLAVLTEGEDTTLPEVELVDLARWVDGQPKHVGVVSFAALQSVLGTRMTKTSLWPPRWRVKAFPAAGELKKLNPSQQLPD